MFSPHVNTQPSPVQIPELVGERFSDVVAGADHLVLLTVDGDVYTMGKGSEGQLGHKVPKATPVQGTVPYKVLRNTHGHRAVAIGASNDTSFFVDQQGDVWAWGLNGYGQTGTGSYAGNTTDFNTPGAGGAAGGGFASGRQQRDWDSQGQNTASSGGFNDEDYGTSQGGDTGTGYNTRSGQGRSGGKPSFGDKVKGKCPAT